MTPPQKPQQLDLYTQVSMMVEEGMLDEARKLENKFRAQGKKFPSIDTEQQLQKFITVDPALQELKQVVRLIQGEDDPVIIYGETGTGKELIARALHGSREPKAFVAVNCAAIPEQLLESELFGYEKGAFTDAKEAKPGLFQKAYKGTMFLDEIGEMPMFLQAKLLRVLQERVIRRVGGIEDIKIECRVVCATNKDLTKLMAESKFRDDLYYRLAVIELHTKPLRERRGDIPLIIQSLDDKHDKLKDIDLTEWIKKDWPGNVRDLARCVRRFQLLGSI